MRLLTFLKILKRHPRSICKNYFYYLPLLRLQKFKKVLLDIHPRKLPFGLHRLMWLRPVTLINTTKYDIGILRGCDRCRSYGFNWQYLCEGSWDEIGLGRIWSKGHYVGPSKITGVTDLQSYEKRIVFAALDKMKAKNISYALIFRNRRG